MIHSTPEIPSHSRLATLAHCKRKFYYSYALGVESREVSTRLNAGKAGHIALDFAYRNNLQFPEIACTLVRDFYKDVPEPRDHLNAGFMELVVRCYYDEWAEKDPIKPMQLRLSEFRQSHLKLHDCGFDESGHIVMAEAAFVVDINENLSKKPLCIIIHPDLVCTLDDDYAITDHKFTTGYLGSNLYSRCKFSHQLRLYALGMSRLLDKPIRMGIINAVYMGDKLLSERSKAQRFDRYIFDYTEAQMKESVEWARELQYEQENIVDSHSNESTNNNLGEIRMMHHFERHFPHNFGAHCGWCEFQSLCELTPELRVHKINQEFVRDELQVGT